MQAADLSMTAHYSSLLFCLICTQLGDLASIAHAACDAVHTCVGLKPLEVLISSCIQLAAAVRADGLQLPCKARLADTVLLRRLLCGPEAGAAPFG